ncbi:MAG: hypothetical protein NZ556_03375 [Fimbriimonadales bacterium]|nr:hypothetical protein [Fimbriimonadales bacterium]
MQVALLDTSILVRERDTKDPNHAVTIGAIRALKQAGWTLYITTQNLVEYWSVATRPASARGGLGLSPAVADSDIAVFLSLHNFLEEPQGLFSEWRQIATQ